MIDIKKIIICVIALVSSLMPMLAQEVVQPKIMVVPYTKEGEDVREVLEKDPAKRIAITVIKEAFDNREFTTVDFLAKLKALSMKEGMMDDAAADLKTQIIDGSGADIYVDAEVIFDRKSEGNKVNLILTAYDIATGNSLANKVGESRRFYTDDVSKLSQLAVNSCAEEFLNTLQNKFTDIVENGRTIQLNIAVSNTSMISLDDSSSSGDTIADSIEEWIEEHAYKNNYHLQGATSKQIIFDEIRVPVKDENGKDFKLRKFRSPLVSHLKAMGLDVSAQVKGNVIFVTIN